MAVVVALMACGVVAALLLVYGLSLIITARPRWPALLRIQEPAAARRWSGGGAVFVAAVAVSPPITLMGSFNPVWLPVQSATISAAATCFLIGGFLHARRQPGVSSRPWIAWGSVFAMFPVVAIVGGVTIGQVGYELKLFGPYLGVSLLAIVLGLTLRTQSSGELRRGN
jgi:hypothetical protein